MNRPRSPYGGYRFPPEITSYCVWLYFRFSVSYRDIEELTTERGVTVFDIVVSADTDSRNDAEAAQAPHIRMLCMTYGYNEGKPVSELPCLAFLTDMSELPGLSIAWCRGKAANARRAASE